jgi:hypothetical protein
MVEMFGLMGSLALFDLKPSVARSVMFALAKDSILKSSPSPLF